MLHNVVALPRPGHLLDQTPAYTKQIVEHVCEMVLREADGSIAGANSLGRFLQEELGHFAVSLDGCKVPDVAEQAWFLMDRAVEVAVLLSPRWIDICDHASVPDMSDYQRRRWMPPAFSCLVGQVLWRHRAVESLQDQHLAVVENLHWVMSGPAAEASTCLNDQCKRVFRLLSGSKSGNMPLSQWRKVMDLLAMNQELRARVRRTDAVRACYGHATVNSESGLNRKQFNLMLMKTAHLMGVHPIVLFQELASHAEALDAVQKSPIEVS